MPEQLCLWTGIIAKCVTQNFANALHIAYAEFGKYSSQPFIAQFILKKNIYTLLFLKIVTLPKNDKIWISPLVYMKPVIKNSAKCTAIQTPPIVPTQVSMQLHNKLCQGNYLAENYPRKNKSRYTGLLFLPSVGSILCSCSVEGHMCG